MKKELKGISKEELKELYDKDFPLWAEINLELLKEKAYELVDWEHLLEEIEDMARSDLKACISYLAVILEHLYKWDNFRHLVGKEGGKGWIKSVVNARREIFVLFSESPSLEKKLPVEISKAWNRARAKLESWLEDLYYEGRITKAQLREYLSQIPKDCPYTYESAMTRDLRKELEDA